METMVNNRLKHYLDQHHPLSETQSGFRSRRSTIDQLVRLEAEIKLAFQDKKKKNRHVIAIFLDLEKAFDLVWSKGLISRLKRYGITGRMFKWIDNFLTDRKIRVRIGDQTSDIHTLENGTPQGSVISPTLFNIMVDSLSKYINPTTSLSQFADDSGVWKAGNPKNSKYIRQIQKGLDGIAQWADTWGFKISTEKTVAMLFSTKKNKNQLYPSLYIQGHQLRFVKQTTFLGMILDEALTWSEHIQNLDRRCQQDIRLMKQIKGSSWGADQTMLLKIY